MVSWTSVVCHSVNSAHGPTTSALNETNVAGVGGGDARRARACIATATRVSALTGSERPAARAAGAPWGVRGVGGSGPTRHGSGTAQLRWRGANALRPRRAHAMTRRPGSPSRTRPWLPCRRFFIFLKNTLDGMMDYGYGASGSPEPAADLGRTPPNLCISLHQPY